MSKKAKNLAILRVIPLLLSAIPLLYSVSANSAEEKICTIYPHLKDSYWLSVNYGMVNEAQALNIELKVLESGGYPNIDKQRQQLKSCKDWGADAIILGTVSPTAFEHDLSQYTGSIPVFATVNHLIVDENQSQYVKGVVGVDWYWMGYKAGKFLASKHPKGSGRVELALLPGPRSSGGTKPVIVGFREAIKDTDILVTDTLWADNDKELQRNLVQQVIETRPNLQYVVGSAVAIEAAISEVRTANLQDQIDLLSIYLSHGVYRGLLRDKVQFAPTDKMVEQGRLSVQQATFYLRSEPYGYDLAPDIETLTPAHLNPDAIGESLSPTGYRPIFDVQPH
ncbi:TMAO reductase system periplasmic protein TorT [Vibrio sp. 10N.286.49.C2]|uniref:TMAO reductase system periplasmic protein TorT n=1 Tax=unclassified Vibrio TaxID=2614977 RepID=UPI000C85DF6B|nr:MULTISPECIES: TMAO reductase system periplasmic protein TorT [unclassified Vibrio]PMH38313.1 TMAO reductase system periplasmic protein TorT [Vibrio sp. 10N.286.49.C2]PMH55721.1 TMAO reductase system periplasmic protein TorT [Vibrio sp. 10N.286.49.B1]PMH80038.1 TMAO reductase system periplasmic protein TorT [Vibrio sp. 10N.286.48.B7]